MDLKTRKGVRTIGIIALILLAAAGFMLVIQPLMTQNSDFSDEMTAAQSEQSTAQQKLADLQRQRETIEDVEALDSDLSEQFPGLADSPSLVAYIQQAASDAGIGQGSISNLTVGIPALVTGSAAVAPAPAADPAGAAPVEEGEGAAAEAEAAPTPDSPSSTNLAEVPVELAVSGSADQIAQFMTNLSESDRNLEILTYALAEGGGEDEGAVTATLSLKTYIYNTVPKVGEAAPEPVVDPNAEPVQPGTPLN